MTTSLTRTDAVEAPAYAPVPTDWDARVARVAAVAAIHADEVDADARFPREAVDAMREERLLGAWVPTALGGLGATVEQITAGCEVLAQQCASVGMVFAMHQIQVAAVVRHAGSSAYLRQQLRDVSAAQQLLASGTSEIGVGGDLRSSKCALERGDDAQYRLRKRCPVVSYGMECDALLVSARREADAGPSDQVLVLLRRADCTLEQTSVWSSLGFRGTCSHGFNLDAVVNSDAVIPVPFGIIASETMVPVSHLVWASVWLGIATDAVRRARRAVRDDARTQRTNAGSPRLAELVAQLHAMRGIVHDAVADFASRMDDPDALGTMSYAIRANNLKLSASESLVEIVQLALRVAGIAGYRLDTPVSLGRALRDAVGAIVMISNDRLLAANATLLLASRED
ncbi:MAG: acyl-CoA dehydrogenase family protein [Gemmatimonadaceae bacterium]